jgi:hypothetical protein
MKIFKFALHKALTFTGLIGFLFLPTGGDLARAQVSVGQQGKVKTAARKAAPRHGSRGKAPKEFARWRTFVGPDDDFTIEFPSEPRLEEGGQETGEVAMRRRYSYYGNSLWLSVTFQDLAFPPNSRQANDLGPNIEEVIAAYTVERGGKALRVQRLAKNIVEEERLVPSRQTNQVRHVISRIIQRNSRMYTLGCVPLVDGQKVDKNICRRFFNSFRVTGIPQ